MNKAIIAGLHELMIKFGYTDIVARAYGCVGYKFGNHYLTIIIDQDQIVARFNVSKLGHPLSKRINLHDINAFDELENFINLSNPNCWHINEQSI